MFCTRCGTEIEANLDYCPKCGNKLKIEKEIEYVAKSESNWIAALLLCVFLGGLGVHRFYVGKVGTGILMLLTCGGCGIWTIIDLIIIATGSFTDSDGMVLKPEN